MTPLAERAFREPMPREKSGFLREIMAGAQYFGCAALKPIVAVRASMPGEWNCADEIIECELPARHTWIDFDNKAIALSRDAKGTKDEFGREINMVGALLEFPPISGVHVAKFILYQDGKIGCRHFLSDNQANELLEICQRAVNTAWYCIEAMQTPGGLCHGVSHHPSRQSRRSSSRQNFPCHKWVEIRLGRQRTLGGAKFAGGLVEAGRSVAWHYRRGHRINHPNPNFPKWRKGGWVGDPTAGIRSHNYVVEVPN